MKILAINPGSTSTKIAVYEDRTELFVTTIEHSSEQLSSYNSIISQYQFRKELILQALADNSISVAELTAVVGRGGLLKPVASGVYRVNEAILHDLKIGYGGEHASNLGGILAYEIAANTRYPTNAFIADPVVVDELAEIARISGIPLIQRRSILHALNQRAMAHKYSKELGRPYESLNLIVAHMGGGISIGVHKQGQIVDTSSGDPGEGTFTPERSGGVPLSAFLELCFSGKYSKAQIMKMIMGQGGLSAYLGTSSVREIEERIAAGDSKAELILQAMAYQIAKEIGSCATVLHGKVDAIILTGGVAYSKLLCSWLEAAVAFLAKVIIYPGENELLALTEATLSALSGEVPIKDYK